MLKKLKSVLKIRTLILPPLALKALIFASLLFYAAYQRNFFWYLIFIILANYFYFRDSLGWNKLLYSFGILVIYSIIITRFLINPFLIIFTSLILGFFFFLLLGIKKFAFLKKQLFFNLLSGALFFIVSLAFFIANKTEGLISLFYYLGAFLSFLLLMKETIDFFSEDFSFPQNKKNLIALGTSFLITEFLAIIAFLPIGFLNSSALTVLIIFTLQELIFYHLQGRLNRQILLNNITIFIIALIFIFATSKWGL